MENPSTTCSTPTAHQHILRKAEEAESRPAGIRRSGLAGEDERRSAAIAGVPDVVAGGRGRARAASPTFYLLGTSPPPSMATTIAARTAWWRGRRSVPRAVEMVLGCAGAARRARAARGERARQDVRTGDNERGKFEFSVGLCACSARPCWRRVPIVFLLGVYVARHDRDASSQESRVVRLPVPTPGATSVRRSRRDVLGQAEGTPSAAATPQPAAARRRSRGRIPGRRRDRASDGGRGAADGRLHQGGATPRPDARATADPGRGRGARARACAASPRAVTRSCKWKRWPSGPAPCLVQDCRPRYP